MSFLSLAINKLSRNKSISEFLTEITAFYTKAIPTEAPLIKALTESRLFPIEKSENRPDTAPSRNACSLFCPRSFLVPLLLISSLSCLQAREILV